jgi:hypothetical protein
MCDRLGHVNLQLYAKCFGDRGDASYGDAAKLVTRQRGGALFGMEISLGVGPFAQGCSHEAFGLSIGFGRDGPWRSAAKPRPGAGFDGKKGL